MQTRGVLSFLIGSVESTATIICNGFVCGCRAPFAISNVCSNHSPLVGSTVSCIIDSTFAETVALLANQVML